MSPRDIVKRHWFLKTFSNNWYIFSYFFKIKNKNKNDAKNSQGVECPLPDEIEACLQKANKQTNDATEQAVRVQQKVSKEWKGRKELWDKGSKQFGVKQQSLENRRNLL